MHVWIIRSRWLYTLEGKINPRDLHRLSRLVKKIDHPTRRRTQSIIFDPGNRNHKYSVVTIKFMLPQLTLSYWSLQNTTRM